jgi:hypothetical protein
MLKTGKAFTLHGGKGTRPRFAFVTTNRTSRCVLPSTNFQIEAAATAFLCGYLIMKITEAAHGCDYCLSHLQDSNSKKKIPLLELIYY